MNKEQESRFAQGLECFRRAEYPAAIRLWEMLEEEGCDEENLALFLKAARTERSRVLAHVAAAMQALESDTTGGGEIVTVAGLVSEARGHLRERHPVEALAALTQAHQIDPEEMQVAVALARLELFQGRVREARAIADKLLLGHPGSVEATTLAGHVLLEMDAVDAAAAAFEKALAAEPADPEALLGAARVDEARRRPGLAARRLGEVLSSRPGDAIASAFLEDVSWQLRSNERALAACRAELARHPDFPDWHFKLGQLLWAAGDDDGALAAYTDALKLNPGYERCLYERSQILLGRGRVEEALSDMRGSFESASGTIDAAGVIRAGELEASGLLEEAFAEYRRARTIEPDYASVHIEMGKQYLTAGLTEQAERELLLGLSLRSDYADGHYHLGTIRRARADLEGAARSFKEAVAAAPEYADALIALGEVELELEHAQSAAALAGQARRARLTETGRQRLEALEARLTARGRAA